MFCLQHALLLDPYLLNEVIDLHSRNDAAIEQTSGIVKLRLAHSQCATGAVQRTSGLRHLWPVLPTLHLPQRLTGLEHLRLRFAQLDFQTLGIQHHQRLASLHLLPILDEQRGNRAIERRGQDELATGVNPPDKTQLTLQQVRLHALPALDTALHCRHRSR